LCHQACDSWPVQRELNEWARDRARRGGADIKIRIVKGANLAMESVEAELHDWPCAVYPTKEEVDANFKRMLHEGCRKENAEHVRLGVASHNLFDLSFAIPCGGVLAALAAGNTVILKPASATALTGWILVRCLWAAGIPREVLQFFTCPGNIGRALLTDKRCGGVVLTGAYETARMFLGWQPEMRLFAETSGKNALIITATADPDQAVKDLVKSAFGHSGQKCSAASLSIIEAEVYDNPAFRRQLRDAAASLKVGTPWEFDSIVTPCTVPPGEDLMRGLTRLDPGEEWLLEPKMIDGNPQLWSPGIRLGVTPDSWYRRTECFGPVLGLVRARDLDEAIRIQNASEFGLTGGIHSLDDREIDRWRESVEVGNAYINRPITGAIVRRQPFGGWKRSCFGPGAKAGGPNYVAQFGNWENIAPPALRLPPAGKAAGLLDQLRKLLPDHAEILTATAECDAYWDKHEFSIEHDPTSMRCESNHFRYRRFKQPDPAAGCFLGADSEFPAHLHECLHRAFQIRAGVGGADLGADARLAMRHHRIAETDDIDTVRQHGFREAAGERRIPQHDRHDRVCARHDVEAGIRYRLAKPAGVGFKRIAQLRRLFEQIESLQRGTRDDRRKRIAEKIGTRPLAQHFDDLPAAAGVAAAGPAERLAEGAGDDVDASHHPAMLVAAAAVGTHETHRMRIIHHHQGVVPLRQVADLLERGDETIHREHPVGGDQLEARALRLGFDQSCLEIGHIAVLVAETHRLAQPHSVDDGRVVEFVADHRILGAQQGFEQAAIRIETRAVENRILGAEEIRQAVLQILVHPLGAADEAYARHAIAPLVQRLVRGLFDRRVLGQAEVVVGTQVEHWLAVRSLHHRALRSGDGAFALVGPGRADLVQLGVQMLLE